MTNYDYDYLKIQITKKIIILTFYFNVVLHRNNLLQKKGIK